MSTPSEGAAPERASLESLLDRCAPFGPHTLVPEVSVFQARGLVEVWENAERLVGRVLPAPFWAYAWAGGAALARVILDHPTWVSGLRVLDVGSGGGIVALAAARAGAARSTANDIDAWALLTAQIAAERQQLVIEVLQEDLTARPELADEYDVLLASDLCYERTHAPRQRALLEQARARGATVLIADAGRPYFKDEDLIRVATYTLDVPADLEGVDVRTASVYALP